ASFTVTDVVSVKLPSLVVNVIVQVPSLIAVTNPVEDTVATSVLSLDQIPVLSVALLGETVSVNCEVFPISSSNVAGVIETLDTFTTSGIVLFTIVESLFNSKVIIFCASTVLFSNNAIVTIRVFNFIVSSFNVAFSLSKTFKCFSTEF